MNYILDACALIAMINLEEGFEKVKGLFDRAHSGEIRLYMNIINLIEVSYGYIRSGGVEKAIEILKPIYQTPLIIIDRIQPSVYQEAARLKALYKRISIADVIGLATAISLKGVFVSADGELKELVALETAPIFWFRPPKEKKTRGK